MSESKPMNSPLSNRRQFVQASAALTALGGVAMSTSAVGAEAEEKKQETAIIRPGDTILFQGDSITDAGRDRETADQPNTQKPLSNGYAWLAAAALLVDRPDDELKIFNRGISGHKVPDLDKRWQEDTIDIKPDVLSILIGVNDIWRVFDRNETGTAKSYEDGYHALIERTMKALPDVHLVICEPFVLRCGAVSDKWFPMFDGYREAARRVSDKAGATFVPFQSMFDEAIKYAPPEHWAGDGVHPSSFGASLMAHCWLKAVGA